MPELSSFPFLFAFWKEQSHFTVSIFPSCKLYKDNPVRGAWKAVTAADFSYYSKTSGQDKLLPGTHLHSHPMQIPLKGPL